MEDHWICTKTKRSHQWSAGVFLQPMLLHRSPWIQDVLTDLSERRRKAQIRFLCCHARPVWYITQLAIQTEGHVHVDGLGLRGTRARRLQAWSKHFILPEAETKDQHRQWVPHACSALWLNWITTPNKYFLFYFHVIFSGCRTFSFDVDFFRI